MSLSEFFNFGTAKEELRRFAVFDISSGSVGGMIVESEKENPLIILSKHRAHSNFLADVDYEAFVRAEKGALKIVAGKLKKDCPDNIDGVLGVFGSPWFIAETKTVKVEREKPFTVTENFFDEIIADEKVALEEKFRGRLAGPEKASQKPEIIEQKFLKTNLNGYQTNLPIDKIARTVESEIYMSLGDEKTMKTFSLDIQNFFGSQKIVFRTWPYVIYHTVSSLLNSMDGFILVGISGETTDIILVRDEAIEELITFPRGNNTLMRGIVSVFNTFPKEVHSLINSYLEGHLDTGDQEKMIKAIDVARADWCEHFTNSFELIKDKAPFPQDVYLIGGGIGKKFIECLEDEHFASFTALGKPFNVSSFGYQALAHFFNLKDSKEKADDTFLMIESLYARKHLG